MRVNGTPQTITVRLDIVLRMLNGFHPDLHQRCMHKCGLLLPLLLQELDVEAFNDCFKVDAVPITFIGNGRSMRGGAPGAHAPIDREGADRLCDVFSTSRRRWWPVLPPGAFYVQSQGLQGSEPNIMQQQQGQEDVSIQTHYWQRHGPHALAGLMSQPVIAGELAGKWATEKQTQLSTFVKLYWDRTAQVPGTDYVVIFDVQQGGMVRPAAQRVHMQSAATCRPSGNLYLDGTTAVASGAKHRKATAQASGAAQLQPDQPVFDFMGWGDGFSIGITDTMQSPKIQPHSLLEGLACGCSALDPDCHIPEPMSMRAAGGTGYSQWSKSRSMMVGHLMNTVLFPYVAHSLAWCSWFGCHCTVSGLCLCSCSALPLTSLVLLCVQCVRHNTVHMRVLTPTGGSTTEHK